MRMLYLDESGIGSLKADPVIVVAGVLIDPDLHYAKISNRLRELLTILTPDGEPVPRFIHTKDVFHGSGEFNRNRWPRAVRERLLANVSSIPTQLDLPVIWSSVDRHELSKVFPDLAARDTIKSGYSIAVLSCLLQTNEFLKAGGRPDEVAAVTMEANRDLQRDIPDILSEANFVMPGLNPEVARYFPLGRVIDTPAFQPKTSASILQLADYCAFAIKRLKQRSADYKRLTTGLASQLMMYREAGEGVSDAVPAIWNPRFMPQMFDHKIVFRDGRFEDAGTVSEANATPS